MYMTFVFNDGMSEKKHSMEKNKFYFYVMT